MFAAALLGTVLDNDVVEGHQRQRRARLDYQATLMKPVATHKILSNAITY